MSTLDDWEFFDTLPKELRELLTTTNLPFSLCYGPDTRFLKFYIEDFIRRRHEAEEVRLGMGLTPLRC